MPTPTTGTDLHPGRAQNPVPVPCRVEAPPAPQWPTLTLKPDARMFDKTKAALAELEIRKGYEELLLAAVRSCR